MKCPKCGKELEIQKKKVGVDENGKPILNDYAICRDCMKQWNLNKQRAHKASQTKAVDHKEANESAVENTTAKNSTPTKTPTAAEAAPIKEPVKEEKAVKEETPEVSVNEAPLKEAPEKEDSAENTSAEEPRYSNIPPKKVRTHREKNVKNNYASMLATDPESVAVKDREEEVPETAGPIYRGFRIVLGILSLLAGGFFAFMGVKDGIPAISLSALYDPEIVYLVLALCMFLTGLILLITQKKNSIAAFLFPMFFSLAGTLFAFFFHDGTSLVLYCAIWCAALTALLLVITITSRFSNSDDAYEEEDDEEEDESVSKKNNIIRDSDDDDFFSDDDFDDEEDDEDDDFFDDDDL